MASPEIGHGDRVGERKSAGGALEARGRRPGDGELEPGERWSSGLLDGLRRRWMSSRAALLGAEVGDPPREDSGGGRGSSRRRCGGGRGLPGGASGDRSSCWGRREAEVEEAARCAGKGPPGGTVWRWRSSRREVGRR